MTEYPRPTRTFGPTVTRMKEGAETLLAGDPGEVERVLEDAARTAKAHAPLWEAAEPLIRLVGAWVRGEFREADQGTIALGLGALMYVAQTVDLTPDYLEGGLDDDTAVLQWVWKRLGSEITRYDAWRTGTDTPPPPPPVA